MIPEAYDLPVNIERIAEVLGGPAVIGPVRTLGQLNAAVERGLPKAALGHVARAISPDRKFQRQLVYRIVPPATYKRRRDKLSLAESEKTERLARVTAQAKQVWGRAEDARDFLTSAHPLLNGRTPVEAAATDLGARQVEAILAGIEYGLPV